LLNRGIQKNELTVLAHFHHRLLFTSGLTVKPDVVIDFALQIF